jgi:hypothetical protein
MPSQPTNADIADVLERVADLLAAQDAQAFRVRAYLSAARTVREHAAPIADLLGREGLAGLEALPTIGRSIASAIRELVETGRLGMLERLEGQVSPEDLFSTVPGIGETLAHRIHAELGTETLEELELAAHDGRLDGVPGFGHRRTLAVRDSLAGILSRSARRRARLISAQGRPAEPEHDRPDLALLLGVDADYRRLARAGQLRTIAPRRFNPAGEAWLPILHAEQGGWSITALYSNTARAHQLRKTRDWVILYYERDGHESQCTVVTETRGPLTGRRVVRGREPECRGYYRSEAAPDDPPG